MAVLSYGGKPPILIYMTTDKKDSLSIYIKAKLDISIKEYASLEGIAVRTLRDRWGTIKGESSIRDAVFRRYVKRFEEL